MKFIRWGVSQLHGRKLMDKQLGRNLQLSIPCACRTLTQIQSTAAPPSFKTRNRTQDERDEQPGNRGWYARTSLGLGLGLFLGATWRMFCDKKDNTGQMTAKVFPIVQAANPFSFTSGLDANNNQYQTKSVSKRLIYNFIADAVEKASDKVVCIDIKDTRGSHSFRNCTESISNGSGFVVSENGLILTNAHVVTNRPRSTIVLVRLHNGKEYEGRVEDLDTNTDLALIRIDCKDLSPVKLGNSSDLRPGEFVAALGSPLSLSNTITAGVVSSVGRGGKELGLRGGKDINYIQTDTTITFGNSGGPLINMDGEVIGINSMTVTSGISFAIPIDYAKEFIANAEKRRTELSKHEESAPSVSRRYLGLTMLTLTPSILLELQARGNAPQTLPANVTHGIFIWRIVIGSPAYHAGLQPGDIVTHINNHEVHSSRDVYKYLEGRGDLTLIVIRHGQRYNVTVVPEE